MSDAVKVWGTLVFTCVAFLTVVALFVGFSYLIGGSDGPDVTITKLGPRVYRITDLDGDPSRSVVYRACPHGAARIEGAGTSATYYVTCA